jgi:hypothetical protein
MSTVTSVMLFGRSRYTVSARRPCDASSIRSWLRELAERPKHGAMKRVEAIPVLTPVEEYGRNSVDPAGACGDPGLTRGKLLVRRLDRRLSAAGYSGQPGRGRTLANRRRSRARYVTSLPVAELIGWGTGAGARRLN